MQHTVDHSTDKAVGEGIRARPRTYAGLDFGNGKRLPKYAGPGYLSLPGCRLSWHLFSQLRPLLFENTHPSCVPRATPPARGFGDGGPGTHAA